MIFSPSACPGILDWLLAIQSPTQRAWTFSPNSLLTSRTRTLRPMKVSGANVFLITICVCLGHKNPKRCVCVPDWGANIYIFIHAFYFLIIPIDN